MEIISFAMGAFIAGVLVALLYNKITAKKDLQKSSGYLWELEKLERFSQNITNVREAIIDLDFGLREEIINLDFGLREAINDLRAEMSLSKVSSSLQGGYGAPRGESTKQDQEGGTESEKSELHTESKRATDKGSAGILR